MCWFHPSPEIAPDRTCNKKNGGEICNRACKRPTSGICSKSAKTGKVDCFCISNYENCRKPCPNTPF